MRQFNLFLFFIFISLLNIITSVHFISITLAGTVFILFTKLFQSKSYYSLIWILLSFIMIETIQGFILFSLFLISLFVYIFIKPSISHLFSSGELTNSLYIVVFYMVFALVYTIFNGFNIINLSYITINMIIDLIVVGLFI